MLNAKTLKRKSEVLLLTASLETQRGLQNPEAQKILQKYPKDLAIKVIVIIITSRPGVQRIIAIGDVLEEFVHEKDPHDIRDCLRDIDLSLVPPLEENEPADSRNEHQKTE